MFLGKTKLREHNVFLNHKVSLGEQVSLMRQTQIAPAAQERAKIVVDGG
jgi:hypothetical protein